MPTYRFTDPAWIDDTGTRLNCFLWREAENAYLPYTLDMSDEDMTVDNEVLLAEIMEAGNITPYVAPPEPTQEEIDEEVAAGVRRERNAILQGVVDPFVTNPLRWGSLTEAEQTEVSNFRAALLDLPNQEGFPYTHTMPETPWCIHPRNINP